MALFLHRSAQRLSSVQTSTSLPMSEQELQHLHHAKQYSEKSLLLYKKLQEHGHTIDLRSWAQAYASQGTSLCRTGEYLLGLQAFGEAIEVCDGLSLHPATLSLTLLYNIYITC